ncbi:MAG: signal peptidase I [Clostridia bacterium]|nr:signal peptidase I [Clostridia bacterium]
MEAGKKIAPAQQESEKKKKKKGKEEKEKKTLKEEIMSWVWTILAAVVIALLIRAFVAEPIRVDGTSMTNTLLDGEIVLVSKLDYRFGDMQRNDVVICRYPGRMNSSINIGASVSLDNYTLFVKRLVALPGDTVEIKAGHLYVNDELVPDPEHMGSVPRDFEKITLEEDQYFVMGDNRRTSHDSRADDVGPISASAIMGKVKCVILPLNAIRGVE